MTPQSRRSNSFISIFPTAFRLASFLYPKLRCGTEFIFLRKHCLGCFENCGLNTQFTRVHVYIRIERLKRHFSEIL